MVNNAEKNRDLETAKLLKEALKIVDKLGGFQDISEDGNNLNELIQQAKKLKKNRLWKL